jgi:hypothetical protein
MPIRFGWLSGHRYRHCLDDDEHDALNLFDAFRIFSRRHSKSPSQGF